MFTAATICLLSVLSQPPELPPFIKDYGQTVMVYYQKPDPKLGPKMLKDLLKKENLEHAFFAKNNLVLQLIASQIGDIGAGKPEIVREYEAAFADTSPGGRKVVIRTLTIAGDKDTAKKVGEWIADKKFEDDKTELEALKNHLEDPKRQHFRDRPVKEPKDLDFLWGNFYITGEYAPVSRILDVFDLPAAKENETLKRVARWTLGSSVQRHPKLVELIQKNKANRPAGSKKVIDETIITFDPKK
jgi:hypothetical protein